MNENQLMTKCDCGGDTFRRIFKVTETWPEVFKIHADGKHEVLEGSTDSLTHHSPRTIRCENCGKRYPNVTIDRSINVLPRF